MTHYSYDNLFILISISGGTRPFSRTNLLQPIADLSGIDFVKRARAGKVLHEMWELCKRRKRKRVSTINDVLFSHNAMGFVA